jgi:hypothetical protein
MNRKAMKASIPSPTPFFCLTSEKEITKIASAIKNRFRPARQLKSERYRKTKKSAKSCDCSEYPVAHGKYLLISHRKSDQ